MTPAKTLYLVRHGHVGPDDLRRYLGRTDWPLSSQGVEQAERLRVQLADIAFERIFTSDLTRARQTAATIGRGRNLTLEILPELGEIDLGVWEGLTPQQVRTRFPAESLKRDADLFNHRPPGGESFADLQHRVLPAFERIAAAATGNTLIVAHAGVNRTLLCHVLGMPPQLLFRLGQAYGALNCIEQCGREYRVTRLNCLCEGNLSPRPLL